MTPAEAAALAMLGSGDRRLLTRLVRTMAGKATAEDQEALPVRQPDESLLRWACRSRASTRDPDGWIHDLARVEREAAAQLARGVELLATALPLFQPDYPPLLAAIPDPPPLLWTRGLPGVLTAPAIAIVGSRSATAYGLAMASRLSRDLASAGLVIVSGLARGVDSAAHAAALSASGRTVGVLGCGIDRIYPAEHRDLARHIEQAGTVVSEFPPGVPPLQHHFPLRNRIISGLSTAVVVVEAPEKSGALITAAAALEQGREVLVVPGPATGGRNRGGHLLIRDGARVVESAEDVVEGLGGVLCARPPSTGDHRLGQLPEAPDFTVDDVAVESGEPARVILARLLDLELAGHIRRIGGGRFIRVK